MTESVGRIGLDLDVNYKDFNQQLGGIAGNAQSMVGGTFKKLGGLIAGAFAVKSLFDFGKGCVEIGSNLAEVQNVVDVTFGSMAQNVNDFASTAIERLGMSELSAKKFTSTMGAMLKSSGLAGQQMLTMSEGITNLAGDMASFYNLSQQDAFDKIRSGISGETEPLKQLGVNMSVANMEAYALTQGIKKQYQEMSQAEQTLLRYNYLLSVTKDAQGDFARTSGSWANQVRVLSEQWKAFQGTMGQAFISLLTPILQVLNALIAKLQVAAQYFKAFVEFITGAESEATSTSATTADAVSGVGVAATDTGKKVKKAGKDIKGSLAGFDQLNTLFQNASAALDDVAASTTGIGSGMPASVSMGEIKTPKLDISSNIASVLNDIKKAFEPASIALDKFKKALQPLKTFAAQGLKDFYNGVLKPLAKWSITQVLPRFIDTLTVGVKTLTTVLVGFSQPFKVFWAEFLQPIAKYAGEKFVGFLDKMNSGLSDLQGIISTSTVFKDLATILEKIAPACELAVQGLIRLGSFVLELVWVDAVNKAKITIDALSDRISFLADIIDGDFSGAWGHFKDFMINNSIGIAEMALNNLKNSFGTLKDVIVEWGSWWISNVKETFGKFGTAISTWWTTNVCPWFTTKKWSDLLFNIGKSLGLAIAAFVKVWTQDIPKWWNTSVAPWFTTTKWLTLFSSIKTSIATTGTNFASTWRSNISNWWSKDVAPWFTLKKWTDLGANIKNGLVTGFKAALGGIVGIMNGIMSAFGTLVNGVIHGVNKIIEGYNSVADKVYGVPSATPLKEWSAPKLTIPAFANGALVSGPTLAMVGDNRGAATDPEVISPLSKLQGMLDGSNQEVVRLLQMLIDLIRNSEVPIVIRLGETELGRASIRAINTVTRRDGHTSLIV